MLQIIQCISSIHFMSAEHSRKLFSLLGGQLKQPKSNHQQSPDIEALKLPFFLSSPMISFITGRRIRQISRRVYVHLLFYTKFLCLKKNKTKQTPYNLDYNLTILTVKPVHPYHKVSTVTPLLITMCFLTGWEGNIERQQGTSRQKKKNIECSTLQLFRRVCTRVSKNVCIQGSARKDFERFLCCVVSILHLHPQKGTAADTGSYSML